MAKPLPVAAWFVVLCAASVSMTIGNKFMMTGVLQENKPLVVILQNAAAVLVLSVLTACRVVTVEPVSRGQLAFFAWDSLVLVVQLYTSFASLQHLPVAATTIVRALAIPVVAWSELLVLGVRLSLARHLCSWVVVVGAAVYAYEDLLSNDGGHSAAGYFWALANLIAYVSNSLLDRFMMTTSKQTACGVAMYTQLTSLPICWLLGAKLEGLSLASAHTVLTTLDAHNLGALLVTGCGAALLGSIFAACYQRASATAVTIAGNVNKAASVLVSALAFGNAVTLTQCVGLVCCLGGAMAFSLYGTMEKAAAADMPRPSSTSTPSSAPRRSTRLQRKEK